jgi:predicted  nucleic acid-binding Zn-ribbon protein
MNDSTTMSTDLDLLAERVEKAAVLVARLRDENAALRGERDDVARRLAEMERGLQGHTASALLAELQQLHREQKEWQGERRDVASRIETLVRKLERLEG